MYISFKIAESELNSGNYKLLANIGLPTAQPDFW
jgi:hypothetical protein